MDCCIGCQNSFDVDQHLPNKLLPCGDLLCFSCCQSATDRSCPTCNQTWTSVENSDAEGRPEASAARIVINYSAMFKVAVVGQVGVGKTTLIHEIAKVGNQRDTHPIRVDDVYETSQQVRGKHYGIQFWDTAGSERYEALPQTHYKNAKMVVMVYDVDSASSFERIRQYWSKEVQERTDEYTLKLVLGNKLGSIPRDSAVMMEEVATFCDEKRYLRYTLSSNSPNDVRSLRQFIALSLVRRLKEEETRQVSQVPLEESEIDRFRSNTKSTIAPMGHNRDKRSVLEDYDDVEIPKRKRWCC